MRSLLFIAAIGASLLVLSAQNLGNTGSVSGRVMDADTLSPLAGVQVGSSETGYAVTDPEGRYRLQGLRPGRLSLSIPSGERVNPWPSKVVTVIAGREVAGVDFRSHLNAEISGRVLDEDGSPLAGVRVVAVAMEIGPNGEMSYNKVGYGAVITDDRGFYAIKDGLWAGRSYFLLAHNLRRFASAISDAPADAASRVRVLTATFYPSADSLSTAQPIVLRSLEQRNADIRMLRKPAYCLEATLMEENRPAQMIFVLSEEDRYAAEFRGVPNQQEGGSSGANGRIRLCGLPSGRYRLAAFSAESTGLRRPTYFNTASITIADRDAQGISVTTLPQATVSGEVVWESSPSDPALLKLTLGIRFDPPATVPVTPNNLSVPSQFAFPATPALRYTVVVSGLRSGLYVKDVMAGSTSILRKPYVPEAGNLRITIAHDGGTLRARVVGTDGQPAVHSSVFAFPVNVQSEVELATRLVEGLTDDDGLFQTPTLQPGRYIILATDDPLSSVAVAPGVLRMLRSPEALARLLRARARGQSVEIGPRATVNVNLTARALE